MKGFLKRDYDLLRENLRFSFLFIGAFALISVVTDFNTGFVALYVVIFAMSSLLGLFNYDEFNHWTAYAAAVSGGRRTMVDARYFLTLLIAAGVAMLQILLGLLGGEGGQLSLAAVYGGIFLFYAAVALPVSYYFGGTKARTAMIVIIAILAGGVGVGGSILNIRNVHGGLRLPPVTLLLPLLGFAALALSRRVSLRIMEGKEL